MEDGILKEGIHSGWEAAICIPEDKEVKSMRGSHQKNAGQG